MHMSIYEQSQLGDFQVTMLDISQYMHPKMANWGFGRKCETPMAMKLQGSWALCRIFSILLVILHP